MKRVLFATLLAGVSTLAFAGQAPNQSSSGSVPTVSFSELKESCTNPAKFHNQNPPTNIQVSCSNLMYKWIPDTAGQFTLTTNRQITASVLSNKYMVGAIMAPVQTPSQDVSCPRLKQVVDRIETQVNVTCDQILSFQGSLTDFCTQAIDNLTGKNPAAIVEQDTGKSIDMCSQQVSQSPAQQQPKQESQQPQQQPQQQPKTASFARHCWR